MQCSPSNPLTSVYEWIPLVAAGSGGFRRLRVSDDFVGSRRKFVLSVAAGSGRFCCPRVSDNFVGSRRWFVSSVTDGGGWRLVSADNDGLGWWQVEVCLLPAAGSSGFQ